MRIVIAPDSFKGTLDSPAVCEAIARGVRRALPGAEVRMVPLSDGGEGLLGALLARLRGTLRHVDVEDPRGRPIRASFGLLGDGTAVVEVAQAIGLALVAESERAPMATSSYGAGQLLAAALATGAQRVLVGLGGSATVDGGTGLAEALGVRFYDPQGHALPPPGQRMSGALLPRIARIDADAARTAFVGAHVEALCDVTTPLVDTLGRLGAARRFGPQKGATPAEVEALAAGLEGLARAIVASGGPDVSRLEGAGAAGGLATALHAFFGAPLRSGIERVLALVDFDGALAGADLVVTGEGRLDAQTAEGKVIAGVARHAARRGIPVVAIVGQSAVTPGEATALGLHAVRTLVDRAGSCAAAMACPGELLEEEAAALAADSPIPPRAW